MVGDDQAVVIVVDEVVVQRKPFQILRLSEALVALHRLGVLASIMKNFGGQESAGVSAWRGECEG